jgi:DNA-binding transcriptional regulator YdaS (Cro superfamily)
MELRAYLDSLPRGGLAAFAAKLDMSAVYLQQLAAKRDGREPSPQLCVDIERATACAVTRRELRADDWWRIWPELVNSDHPIPPGDSEAEATASAQA